MVLLYGSKWSNFIQQVEFAILKLDFDVTDL
jgi:hypothetical protein